MTGWAGGWADGQPGRLGAARSQRSISATREVFPPQVEKIYFKHGTRARWKSSRVGEERRTKEGREEKRGPQAGLGQLAVSEVFPPLAKYSRHRWEKKIHRWKSSRVGEERPTKEGMEEKRVPQAGLRQIAVSEVFPPLAKVSQHSRRIHSSTKTSHPSTSCSSDENRKRHNT